MSGPTQLTFALKTPTGGARDGREGHFRAVRFRPRRGHRHSGDHRGRDRVGWNRHGQSVAEQNIAGLRNTSYKITVTTAAGSKTEIGAIIVPESETPVPMHTLVPLAPLGGLTVLVLTEAEYEGLESRNDQTLYLIRAEG